jgi:cytochrome bd ubiquinol oxidase subunit II
MGPTTFWFALEAVLLCLTVAVGSFGCGVGILFPLLGGEKEKREALEIIRPFAPVQAVLLPALAAGLLLGCPAALPAFLESLPVPALLLLVGLVLKTAAAEVRPRMTRRLTRAGWSAAVFFGSLIAMFAFGYIAANLLTGFPLGPGAAQGGSPRWSLSIYSVIGGCLLFTYAAFHGALFLSARAEGDLLRTLRRDMPVLSVNLMVFALTACILTAVEVPISRPWSTGHPLHWIFAGLAVVVFSFLVITVLRKTWMDAFGFSGLLSSFVILSLAAAEYPIVIPSRADPSSAVRATGTPAASGLPAALTLLAAILPVLVSCLLFLLLRRERKGPADQ